MGLLGRSRQVAALCLLSALFATPAVLAQPSDPEPLPCAVDVFHPQLDYEFRFFSAYRVNIPTRRLEGPERSFLVKSVVRSLDQPDSEPAEFERRFKGGPIVGRRGQTIEISSSFVTGEGRYEIRWYFADSQGPSCAARWEIEARRSRSDRDVRLSIAPGRIDDSRVYAFRPEDPIVGGDGRPLRLKVFLSLDVPPRRSRTQVRLWELMPRIAALRALSRHPRISEFALVVYSVEEQAVLFRHGLRDRIEFSALEAAVDKLDPAFVSIDQLGRRKEGDFFANMLLEEVPGKDEIDAYLFVGPDVFTRDKLDKDALAASSDVRMPVFFLAQMRTAWKGLVSRAVAFFHGKRIRFASPRQLAEGVEELVKQIDRDAGL